MSKNNHDSLKILMALIEAPLPFGNAAARWFYVLLNELSARGHKITIFCTSSNPSEIDKSQKIFKDNKNITLNFYSFPVKNSFRKRFKNYFRPFSYMFSEEFNLDWNKEIENNYDIIHLEQTWCGNLYIPKNKKSLINVHHFISIDLEDRLNKSWKQKVEFFKIKHTEKKIMAKFEHIRACSPRIKNKILEWHPGKIATQIYFVPVGLDSSLYQFIAPEKRNKTEQKTVSLIASLHWSPGQTAAFRLITKIWPIIKNSSADAVLQIVGWNAKKVLHEYVGKKDIIIEENVPDITPYFERSSLLLYAPDKGSGMKIKILESMLLGIPVVTTIEGVEGLQVIDGEHVMIGSTDQELADKAIQLLNDITLQEKIRPNARRYVETQCSPTLTTEKILKIYSEILK